MKIIGFFLASFTAIALLSCSSFENSNSSAEDVNYQQIQALNKASPIYEEQQASSGGGGSTRTTGTSYAYNCGSMNISGIPVGGTGWSSKAICDFTHLPSNSWNVSYQFIAGNGPTSNGNFTIDYVEIICGDWIGNFNLYNYANIYTTAFETGGDGGPTGTSTPANVRCSLRFYGKCYGSPVGGGSCSLSYSNYTGTQIYTY